MLDDSQTQNDKNAEQADEEFDPNDDAYFLAIDEATVQSVESVEPVEPVQNGAVANGKKFNSILDDRLSKIIENWVDVFTSF